MSQVRDIADDVPLIDLEALLGGRRPLILAPHPDDESLGCGGLIAAACTAGLPPAVAILTDGAASHPQSRTHPPARLAAIREGEALDALRLLGLAENNCFFLRAPDTQLVADGALIDRLTGIAEQQGCGIIIGPWAGDPHCDHVAGADAAQALAARLDLPLLSYPVWGWLREDGALLAQALARGVRLDIRAQLAAKGRAVAAHASQYGDLITDSPDGFRLPENLLEIFARPYELFLCQ
jgi:LmbE family N-acetylglucosaminyl deacetylase